ncbi:PLP-dependent aminotransferase family protein [Kurthia massiliensis]|uniref:MocR-like pyridoxine biosynthesis transcription factor PdxR n=1 Tax=Kurthia massiliensis TaxID=1033739 RepID=UPI000289BE25|nr:PLP-dependent aminotransferase family protein [Kurthia massiliensis]
MDMLMFELDKEATVPLYEQLYEAIKTNIIDGSIPVQTKLPSKRKLAEFLMLSQTTIELAYGQLLAEGYIMSKPRIGFFVEDIATLPYVDKTAAPLEVQQDAPHYDIDFSPSRIDTAAFPFTAWRRYAKDVIDEQKQSLLLSGAAQGEYALREEIAHYLYQSRGVHCSPAQIVIGSGTEQLIPMIMQILGNGHVYALENPGYQMTHHIIEQYGERSVPIRVDDDGIDIDMLKQSAANIAYVTPSHQFPTGAILSAPRRIQLLQWASAEANRYIIEDDYDSEFRYIGKPIPSLQSMDHQERVIYLSTFSKSLMPSLRIAYFVLPKTLLARYHELFTYYTCTVPRFEQSILAQFMRDGHFSKHLNRMRKIYRKKLERLTDAIAHYEHVNIAGEQAGMHVDLIVRHSLNAKALSDVAKAHHIRISPLSRYMLTHDSRYDQHLLLGFGGFAEDEIARAIDTLFKLWGIQKGST